MLLVQSIIFRRKTPTAKIYRLAFFSGFRRRQETGGNRVCTRAA
nr:MAG TPA: hypothetical protein [Caudoviricetes sp.]